MKKIIIKEKISKKHDYLKPVNEPLDLRDQMDSNVSLKVYFQINLLIENFVRYGLKHSLEAFLIKEIDK